MRIPVLVLAPALALSACGQFVLWRESVDRAEMATTVYPENYRAEILSFMRSYLNDPTEVRGAFISEPVIRTVDSLRRYMVCIRYNAKKTGGQYAGSRDGIVVFRQGRLDRILDDLRDPRIAREIREHCKEVDMKPFTELEKLS